jgi:predicted DNA-binding mobile mystery protein A
LTTKQFAKRLGVSQPRVVALEKGEAEETVTLASLRRAAEALDCRLVYTFVPDRPLVDILRARAERMADVQMARLNHTMTLENQALTLDDQRRRREDLIGELLRGSPSRLWNDEA